MTTTPTLREAAQQFVQDYENGDLGDLKHYARSMRAALAEQAAEQAEPAVGFRLLPSRLTNEMRAAMADAARAYMARTGGNSPDAMYDAAVAAAPPAPAAAEQAEPVEVPASIVAGAIFDFAGFLTTHKRVIKVGSTANASPVVERIKEWAGLRGLLLDNADVLSWKKNAAPPAPARQEPLTSEQVKSIVRDAGYDHAPAQHRADFINGMRHAERAHGITAAPAEGGAA